jgi:hypothetical protein
LRTVPFHSFQPPFSSAFPSLPFNNSLFPLLSLSLFTLLPLPCCAHSFSLCARFILSRHPLYYLCSQSLSPVAPPPFPHLCSLRSLLHTTYCTRPLLTFPIRINVFDADPDPDPCFQIKAQNLEKVLKKAHISSILACHLQIHFDADLDPAPNPTFQDPQHSLLFSLGPFLSYRLTLFFPSTSTSVPTVSTISYCTSTPVRFTYPCFHSHHNSAPSFYFWRSASILS